VRAAMRSSAAGEMQRCAAILELTLQYGPASVLTNGTVFKDEWLTRLRRAEDASPYSLEFRVSIDGFSAAATTPSAGRDVRAGDDRVIVSRARLPADHHRGRTRDDENDTDLVNGFVRLLKANGYERPRLKFCRLFASGRSRTPARLPRRRARHDELWKASIKASSSVITAASSPTAACSFVLS